MSKKLLKALAVGVAGGVFASSAMASGEGLYFAAHVGPTMNSKLDVDTNIAAATVANKKMESKIGFAGGLAVGYEDGNNLSYEGELLFHMNSYKNSETVTSTADAGTASDGKTRMMGLMGNVAYNFYNMVDPMITPYVGGGVGYMNVKHEYQVAAATAAKFDKSSHLFGFQVILGSMVHMTPEMTAFFDYRFTRSFNKFKETSNNLTVDQAFQSHVINAGIRYHFG